MFLTYSLFLQVQEMESQLQKNSQKAMLCQEQKAQLEEIIAKLHKNIREMKNTLEKYSASIKVIIIVYIA